MHSSKYLITTLLILINFIFSNLELKTEAKLFSSIDKNCKVNDIKEKYEYINFEWWKNFEDSCLEKYIIKAIEHNHEIKKTTWKIEEYRQFVKVNFANELPELSVSSSYFGLNTPNLIGNVGVSRNTFVLPFFMKYEADFLLKNRDKTKASNSSFEASKEDEKAAYISLVSNVGTTYFNIVKYDKIICLLKRITALNCELYKREQQRYKRGIRSATEVNLARQEVADSKNKLDESIKIRKELLNQLAILIGESPYKIKNLERNEFENIDYHKKIPKEICADCIFERPDVLSAEKKLAECKINLRVAKKEFFPSFNILGVYSFNTVGPGNFFGWQSTTAALIAAATQDIFKGGLKLANLRIKNSKYMQGIENLKQVDLIAMKEVNDSLCFIKQDTKIDNETKAKYCREKDNFNRNANRFNAGVLSKPEIIKAEKKLISIEQEKANTKLVRLIDYITLYKATGGNL